MDKKMEKLLKLLQDDAKLTVSQLAVMLNLTEEEVTAAIRKFEKDGVIKGYRTIVNWERTDVHRASALIELRITPKKDSGFDELAARVKAFPEVESVYLMSGGFDLAVTVTAATMSEIAMFVAKRLAPIDGVLSTATHFVLTKYNDMIYISARAIDEVNVQLIMERLGGGGHMNIAGAQLKDMTLEEARLLLRDTITEMTKEGEI